MLKNSDLQILEEPYRVTPCSSRLGSASTNMQLEYSDMSYVEYMKVLWYAIVEGIVECGKTFIYSTYDISERSN